jgi:hypothetical protein
MRCKFEVLEKTQKRKYWQKTRMVLGVDYCNNGPLFVHISFSPYSWDIIPLADFKLEDMTWFDLWEI